MFLKNLWAFFNTLNKKEPWPGKDTSCYLNIAALVVVNNKEKQSILQIMNYFMGSFQALE